jgi:cell division protein FtsB
MESNKENRKEGLKITSAAISDSATNEDLLDFDQFAIPIASKVIDADDKNTPMTIGIFGEWGSGKTSFLMMVDEVLRDNDIYPVWFNAWKYDREENLWSALIQTILDQAKISGNWYQRLVVKVKLWKDDLSFSSGIWEIFKKLLPIIFRVFFTVSILVLILGFSSSELKSAIEKIIDQLFSKNIIISPIQSNLIKGILALLGVIAVKPDSFIKYLDPKLGIDFSKLSRKKSYKEHIAFLDEFSGEFEHIIKIIGRGKPLVVIIDDLDRCLPEKALQILEAIKLFLDVKRCVFLLAVDREVVEKAVSVKYKDLFNMMDNNKDQALDKATFLGENYFDKIIHLSVPVPPLNQDQVEKFIKELYRDTDIDTCSKIFSTSLPRNPRKIKRILQNFLFLRDISKKNTQTKIIVTSLLAKMVIIQYQFRDLYRQLIRFPELLSEIEKYYNKKVEALNQGETVPEPEIDDLNLRAMVETFANQDLILQDVLMEHISEKDTFIGTNVANYVFLTRTVIEESIVGKSSTKRKKILKDKDFFISYHNSDKGWAEWIAWQLEEAGYKIFLQSWDFKPGSNFVLEMENAITQSDRIIAVISKNYIESISTMSEWQSSFAQDPTGRKRILLPIRVEDCELKGILKAIVYVDFVGLDQDEARDRLLSAIKTDRAKPDSRPSFPKQMKHNINAAKFPNNKKN